jgi:ribose/xylose/arabinose/galactoside ABC-type transport system permease subunit
LALLLATVALITAINPDFLSVANVRDILVKASPVAIVACALTLVIVTGEIDISVGSLMGFLAAVMGVLTSASHAGWPVGLGVAATLLLGAVTGLTTGALVTWGRVPSIIVTLGMLTVLRGLTELVMGGEWIKDLPPGLRFFGAGSPGGIPVSVMAAAGTIVGFQALTRWTPLGRRIYAVGSNPHAARLAGISPRRIKIIAFGLVGFFTGVATLVSVPQLSVIESGIGVGFEMVVVTCVVVGGTSISGGRGSILGSVLGVLLLSSVGTMLIFLRLGERSTYWERAIQGAFILLAVLVDHLTRRRAGLGSRP